MKKINEKNIEVDLTQDYLFVPIEIARVLKNIGYDVPAIRYWNDIAKCFGIKDFFNWNQSDRFISIPMYDQVFTWFLVKYKLCGLIEIGTQEYSYQIYNKNGNNMCGTDPIKFNAEYNEARNQCIKELIKLIQK